MMKNTSFKKVVLAYSGGLDTSAIVPWLKENYDCEVVCCVGDIGQDPAELKGVQEKAIKSGASSCHVVDLKEQFAREAIFPLVKAGCVYEGVYLLGTSMARPILARAQVEVAKQVGADALSHGCTGKGNDQVRFESTFAALSPELPVIAPWRIWSMRSREDLLNYLAERKIPTTASITKIYSRDENAFHLSTEGGELESSWNAPGEDIWQWTKPLAETPNTPAYVTLDIEQGEIRKVNGEVLSPYHVVKVLNEIGAAHGIGRVDLIENRLVGMKSRGCYETPGGTIMMNAVRGLEQLVYDRDSLKLRQQLALDLAEKVYDGKWFVPATRALFAAIDSLATQLTGTVVVELFKGHATVTQRKSPNSLYSEAFATFGKDEVYNQAHAEGFIRLFSLPSRIRALKAAGKTD
ncbi:MAG: argininosuccinate synthase [Permianibacter sp.]